MAALSPELRERSYKVLFDSFDYVYGKDCDAEQRGPPSSKNFTEEGRKKLVREFRSEANQCKDTDVSKSTGLRLFSLWLESSPLKSPQDWKVFEDVNRKRYTRVQ